jgi:cellulose synthase/poly-beta-1,6-N-acetylglucosamine synthase-like glycosyltransferase
VSVLGTFLTVVQFLYLASLLTTIWLRLLPVDRVSRDPADYLPLAELPPIVMLYPVLRELEETMRTTLIGMARAQYPADRLRVICIPNRDDEPTIAAAQRLAIEFPFLEVMPVPPTTDASWQSVWTAWELNDHAYWWHAGRYAGETNLPPKKTRQLIWALYQLGPTNPNALLSYLDADSVVPTDYWQTAAVGMRDYDVVQFTNITGNLLATLPTSFHALDHILWDASLYPHMSAHGRHPFYTLGKGLFFRISDLLRLGSFHPWLTIEDPEVGMRLWCNGARLGVVESPLVEEVPATWGQGVLQRKRWICGFFQTLGRPLAEMGMTGPQRMRARLNFVPCLSLLINPVGFAIGIWAVVDWLTTPRSVVSGAFRVVALVTLALTVALLGWGIGRAWRLSHAVLDSRRQRAHYLLRVNPVFVMLYWLWWSVSLIGGFAMYRGGGGLVWQRTEKVDANHSLIRFGLHRSNRPLADVARPSQADPTG